MTIFMASFMSLICHILDLMNTPIAWIKWSFCSVNQNLFFLLFAMKHIYWSLFNAFLDTFCTFFTGCYFFYASRKNFIYSSLAFHCHYHHYEFILILPGKVTTVPYTIAFPQKSVLCQNSRKLIKALIVTKTTGNITFSVTEDVGCLPKLWIQLFFDSWIDIKMWRIQK